MAEAFAWGFIAASSLLIGGLLALRRPIGLHPLGLIMAFGAGVLISAGAPGQRWYTVFPGKAVWRVHTVDDTSEPTNVTFYRALSK